MLGRTKTLTTSKKGNDQKKGHTHHPDDKSLSRRELNPGPGRRNSTMTSSYTDHYTTEDV